MICSFFSFFKYYTVPDPNLRSLARYQKKNEPPHGGAWVYTTTTTTSPISNHISRSQSCSFMCKNYRIYTFWIKSSNSMQPCGIDTSFQFTSGGNRTLSKLHPENHLMILVSVLLVLIVVEMPIPGREKLKLMSLFNLGISI